MTNPMLSLPTPWTITRPGRRVHVRLIGVSMEVFAVKVTVEIKRSDKGTKTFTQEIKGHLRPGSVFDRALDLDTTNVNAVRLSVERTDKQPDVFLLPAQNPLVMTGS